MGELDQVSGAIGALNQFKETMTSQHAIMNNKLDQIISSTVVIDKKADRAHERMDEIDELLTNEKGSFQRALKTAEWVETKKKQAWWTIGGASLAIGTGSVLTNKFLTGLVSLLASIR